MRQGPAADLGFTADDRTENLRRSSEVAKIINDCRRHLYLRFCRSARCGAAKRPAQAVGERPLHHQSGYPRPWKSAAHATAAAHIPWPTPEKSRHSQASAPVFETRQRRPDSPTHEISVAHGVERIIAALKIARLYRLTFCDRHRAKCFAHHTPLQ